MYLAWRNDHYCFCSIGPTLLIPRLTSYPSTCVTCSAVVTRFDSMGTSTKPYKCHSIILKINTYLQGALNWLYLLYGKHILHLGRDYLHSQEYAVIVFSLPPNSFTNLAH